MKDLFFGFAGSAFMVSSLIDMRKRIDLCEKCREFIRENGHIKKGAKRMKIVEQLGISPTPWKQGEWVPYCENNIVRCDYNRKDGTPSTRIVAECNATFSTEQARIDAHLIAAAPELYEALATFLNCAEKEGQFTTESGMSIAMDMARKALKKAGGER